MDLEFIESLDSEFGVNLFPLLPSEEAAHVVPNPEGSLGCPRMNPDDACWPPQKSFRMSVTNSFKGNLLLTIISLRIINIHWCFSYSTDATLRGFEIFFRIQTETHHGFFSGYLSERNKSGQVSFPE